MLLRKRTGDCLNKRKIFAFQVLVLVIGAIFVGIGINNGEYDSVLQKAILICLECIGIG